MPDAVTRSTGPLRPIELATASVLATLAVVLTVAGWFLPHLSVVAAFAVVPLGVVAHHHRLRALLVATFAASVLSFLVAGTGSVTNVVECAAVGGLVGTAKRRGWGFGVVLLGSAVVGPVLAGVSIGLLAVFGSLRKLTLRQIVNTWHGVRKILDGLFAAARSLGRGVGQIAHDLGFKLHDGIVLPKAGSKLVPVDRLVNDAVRDWWISVGVIVLVATLWFAVLGWVFIGAVLERLQWIQASDRLDQGPAGGPGAETPGPIPVTLRDVGYRYPGSEREALAPFSARIEAGRMVALVGDNGSGKSTLTRILAGRAPTSGRVERPGGAGLGRPDGTALILQHPETQVLGVRVADDVVWGLPADHHVDIEDMLGRVGLEGMGERETSGLSGGELQRLAVAAALARRPRLLISDESTAMVDHEGRERLTALLRDLPGRFGMSVVHVTHRPEEAARADVTYRLAVAAPARSGLDAVPAGGAGAGPAGAVASPSPAGPARDRLVPLGIASPGPVRSEVLRLVRVGHVYGIDTPWAKTALEDVALEIEPREGVLIVGDNGSGKSTLAWIMAGLLRPTTGECLLGDDPVRARIGSVALAFQHARLQLQRATVGRDIRAAGAPDDDAVTAALAAVGLDAAEFSERRIDALSGGQQRRVALAGLLARRPSALVLDEPLAGLDQPSRDGLVDLLVGLRRDHGLTLVVISHDLEGMERVCDRAVRMEQGRIVGDTSLTEVAS